MLKKKGKAMCRAGRPSSTAPLGQRTRSESVGHLSVWPLFDLDHTLTWIDSDYDVANSPRSAK
jgi:hypothetical protein